MKDSEELHAPNRSLEAFKNLVPHLRGALWWGSDESIHEKHPAFVCREDREGHPLLSLRQAEVHSAGDVVPMLFGTSGDGLWDCERCRCIAIKGVSGKDAEKLTYFGSIVEPGRYTVDELLDAVLPKKGSITFVEKKESARRKGAELATMRHASQYEFHSLVPNWGKLVVDKSEMPMIDRYCLDHNL